MTPREKADELYSKLFFALPSYADEGQQEHKAAKYCALITVDEIKEALLSILDNDISSIHAIYWEKVKQEIEKL
jgi:hypothetical protein